MYVDTKHLINRKIIKIIVKNKMLPINRDNLKYHFFGGRSYIIFQLFFYQYLCHVVSTFSCPLLAKSQCKNYIKLQKT